ncbi:MAG: hypothetical protein R8J85_05275 [Mariprofundales bacterium]
MIPLLGSLLAIAGIIINMSIPETMIAPDISGSLLIAAIVARRRHWPWVLPLFVLHDMMLYWSPFPPTPLFVLLAMVLVTQIDLRLGAALPQRIMMIAIAHIPMALEGVPLQSIALSLLLTFALWYWIREQVDTLLQPEPLPPSSP